mmetsp:Transcript_105133/g.279794  ORF Transcript_105133/g.279794 Transcript_105133/m.279794 type:complete len:244 (+) Transcript_105133:2625-3356(+)
MSTSQRMNGMDTSPSVPSSNMDQYSLGPKPSPGRRDITDITCTLSPWGKGLPFRMPYASALDCTSPSIFRVESFGGSARIHDCSTAKLPTGLYLKVILSERKTNIFFGVKGSWTSSMFKSGLEIRVMLPPWFSSHIMQQSFLLCKKAMCSSTLPSSMSSSLKASGLKVCSSFAVAQGAQSMPLVRSPKWKSSMSKVRGAQAAARFVRLRSKRESASDFRVSTWSGSGISVSMKPALPLPSRPR